MVFVHGFLVDSRLWDPVAEVLATQGIRSFLVDWPLGCHRTPMPADADLTPLGVARMVNEALEFLGLDNVTLVGGDTGGAICQLLIADDASRIGRIVLTNCDAFDTFPPKVFLPLFLAAKHPGITKLLLAPMRLRFVRHSMLGFGLLLRRPRDAALTRHWISPAIDDVRIRKDIARFVRGVDPAQLGAAAHRLRHFRGPASVVWGMADRWFTPALGRQLSAAFANAQFVEVPDVSTFVSIDAPAAVATAIATISGNHPQSPDATSSPPT